MSDRCKICFIVRIDTERWGEEEEGRRTGERRSEEVHSPYRFLHFDKDLRHTRQPQSHSHCQCSLSHKHRCTLHLPQHPHTLRYCGRERTCSNQCLLNSWHQRRPLDSHICIRWCMVVSWWYLAFVLSGRREGNPEGGREEEEGGREGGRRRKKGWRWGRRRGKTKRGGEKNSLVLTFCSFMHCQSLFAKANKLCWRLGYEATLFHQESSKTTSDGWPQEKCVNVHFSTKR